MLPILSSSSSVHSLTPEFSFLIFFFSVIVSIFLSPDHFPFHRLQFLSSLPQYSWLYLLSDHLNSFLAVKSPWQFSSSKCFFFMFLSCYIFHVLSIFLFKLLNYFFCILQVLPSFPSIKFHYKPCKRTILGQCLVTWVGSHLRAAISLIAFPCLPCLPFCVILCDSFKSIIGQCVNICQVPWERCLNDLVV